MTPASCNRCACMAQSFGWRPWRAGGGVQLEHPAGLWPREVLHDVGEHQHCRNRPRVPAAGWCSEAASQFAAEMTSSRTPP